MACLSCRSINETLLSSCVCATKGGEKVEEVYSFLDSGFPLDSGSEKICPSSNLHTLLRTNYYPQNPSELTQIRTLLNTAKISLTSLDSDIAHVQQVLSTLFTKRATLQHTISSHQSLLSPIRRLPNELLSEIFLSRVSVCGGSGGDIGSSLSFTHLHTDALWTILQVCSLWRTIAQLTPRLWNTLRIDLTSLKGKPRAYKNLLTRLSICFANFLPTALPLNFAITGTHYQDSAHLLPLIEALCTHADRWGKVYFCPYTTNILASWNLDPKLRNLSSTPQLSALGLTSFNPIPGFIQTPTRFTHTPRLCRLALYDYRQVATTTSDTHASFLPPFCSQLTHLYLDSCPYSAYSEILSYLPRLMHLEILNKYQQSTRFLDTSSPTQQGSIHLPELRTLKATGWLSNLCFLLPQFDIPMIEMIEMLALAEKCHPCTCAVVKKRMVNDWVETLRTGVRVNITHMASWEVKTSTDEGIVEFLFG
ncbi:hypothetical protein D9756_006653 [Leucocoprinus leucothites]|uniref:F-box domain-containing protein n=1 Tax=Leucocoprinus leucothites TaxID=201217 RepID=A0A8H5G274_9AGAR|nr:hypothetical protein D9756_006653 [Leucoagaricus leucothites]